MNRLIRQERGAAITETVVMMLVLVPLILYSLFTSDLVAYKLDVQELVTSTVWDFTTQNYEKESMGDPANQVTERNKEIWCDNSVIFNNPGGSDCSDPPRQEGFMAKMVYAGSDQISCTQSNKDMGTGGYSMPLQGPSDFHSDFTTGGGFTCKATGTVYNYWIPQKFLQKFANNDLSKFKDHRGEDIRGLGGGSAGAIKIHEEFSIFTDSWALTNSDEVDRDSDSPNQPYTNRVWEQYKHPIWYIVAVGMTAQFVIEALSKQEAIIPAIPWREIDTPDILIGTDPFSLHMVARHGPNKKESTGWFRSDDFYSMDYPTWVGDKAKQAWDNRDDNYMGCTSSQKENCN
jgi:hypothetical protein